MNSPRKARLLYRGSLSLPDSYILLDGLTFFATPALLTTPNANTLVKSPSSPHLLENPLALALESMRGRPSLNLVGTVKIKDIYLDNTGGVRMEIHPHALISRLYFENVFCLSNDSVIPASEERSAVGVKVALGDGDQSGVGITEIIIYARTVFPTPGQTDKNQIELHVSRLVPAPPSRRLAPRPDDPTPRKPEMLFRRTLSRGGPSRGLSRTQSDSGVVAVLGSKLRLGDGTFKVPHLPVGNKGKAVALKPSSKMREVTANATLIQEDVFGSRAEPSSSKTKRVTESQPSSEAAQAIEASNKTKIKRHIQDTLTAPPYSLAKTSTEFKEVFSWIYRGTSLVLRHHVKLLPVDRESINRIVTAHLSLYVHGAANTGAE